MSLAQPRPHARVGIDAFGRPGEAVQTQVIRIVAMVAAKARERRPDPIAENVPPLTVRVASLPTVPFPVTLTSVSVHVLLFGTTRLPWIVIGPVIVVVQYVSLASAPGAVISSAPRALRSRLRQSISYLPPISARLDFTSFPAAESTRRPAFGRQEINL
jgi:hypothetical protein